MTASTLYFGVAQTGQAWLNTMDVATGKVVRTVTMDDDAEIGDLEVSY